MASQRIEEIMRQASAKEQAAFKESVQTLKDNNVQLKADSYGPQTPPRRAEQTNTSEPKLNETVFPNQQSKQEPQRGAQKIEQARTEMQGKAAEPSQAQEKSTPTQNQERDR
ncbi:hypothetical protein ACO2Q8_29210 [Larkinella sp. VNQ87]|uniref:hypothetical protein n=1 Tax=Larkinella sp. VNQ87 TaxID=3400921 RepID=UPI003C085DD3